jgi:D-sedoheptulose 7-phosphate isomerase
MDFNNYLNDNIRTLTSLDREEVGTFVAGLDALRKAGKTLWIAGNGGSASTASHAVADFNKTISDKKSQPIRSVSISEMQSLTTAYANDVNFSDTISGPLSHLAMRGDGLLVISVSGTSPNILSALNVAKEMDLRTFCMFGAAGILSAKKIAHPIIIDSRDYQVVENVQLFLIHLVVKVMAGQGE